MTKLEQYRNGGDGFILWAEENVYINITPIDTNVPVWTPLGALPDKKHSETNRSYRDMWERQKEVLHPALEMRNKEFVHRVIILCWPRGDGKSIDAVLIQLWKFFNFAEQLIVLGANSRDQVRFLHFDIMCTIIKNSPQLLNQVGLKNIQRNKILLRGKKKQILSSIQPISAFSGIVSNITGYTFTEFFAMKNDEFFTQLDGSTRFIPNALGLIDTTISSQQHRLRQMYDAYIKNQDETLFFSYRFSKEGNVADYWNPRTTKKELNGYKVRFPLGGFERYFLNIWSAGAEKVFTLEIIEATNYLGVDKLTGTHGKLMELITKRNNILNGIKMVTSHSPRGGMNESVMMIDHSYKEIASIEKRLWPIEDVLSLRTGQQRPQMATLESLNLLSDIYDTDWALMVGIDRADPMKTKTPARTILVAALKGLPGSRSNPFPVQDGTTPNYIYIVVHVVNIVGHTLEEIKEEISALDAELKGVDAVAFERHAGWDLAPFCEERDIPFELPYPTYGRQNEAFTALFLAYRYGAVKIPPLAILGSRDMDILKEEAEMFDHDDEKKWFGSPEKKERYGVQDDAMYAFAWCIYGGRLLAVDDFKMRKGEMFFGQLYKARSVAAGYR